LLHVEETRSGVGWTIRGEGKYSSRFGRVAERGGTELKEADESCGTWVKQQPKQGKATVKSELRAGTMDSGLGVCNRKTVLEDRCDD
jgi:hypothetical protein